MSSRNVLRIGAFTAFAAALLLVGQVLIALQIGTAFELFGKSLDPVRMTSFFEMHARAVTLLMTVDDAFAVAYALSFVILAVYLLPRTRILAILALVFSLQTALTDFAENSLTLVAVQTVVQHQPLDGQILGILYWLGQLKYLASYLAVVLFAPGVWTTGRMGRTFAVLLVLFPLIGILSISIEALALAQIGGMLVLLVAGGVYLLWEAQMRPTRQSDPASGD